MPCVLISIKQSSVTFLLQGILSNEDETAMLRPDFTYFNPIPSARNQRISKKSEDGLRELCHNNLQIRGFFGRME